MLAAISAATLTGAVGRPVSVEVHVSSGLPGFTMVGLPDAAVRESRDRVRAALLSSGLPWPLRRVTVNLAPSTFEIGKVNYVSAPHLVAPANGHQVWSPAVSSHWADTRLSLGDLAGRPGVSSCLGH
jgi:magnesium chelatase family protein